MAIFDVLKTAAKIAQEAGKIDLYGQILEVYEKLLEQQTKILTLEEENKDLRKRLNTKENLTYQNNAYWVIQDEKKDGPFCSRCWDVQQNLVRIKQSINSSSFHTCPECKTQVQTNPNFQPTFIKRDPPSYK